MNVLFSALLMLMFPSYNISFSISFGGFSLSPTFFNPANNKQRPSAATIDILSPELIKKEIKDKIIIREALIHELMQVVALRVDVFYPEFKAITSFHLRILDKMKHRVENEAICLIAVLSDTMNNVPTWSQPQRSQGQRKILGTVEICASDFKNTSMEYIGHEKKLYAMDLAVQLEARRLGIGSSLLFAMEKYARNEGYKEIYLHVEVDNESARNLYMKNGYMELPATSWAVAFTQKRLHKPPSCYVLLWKEIVWLNTVHNYLKHVHKKGHQLWMSRS